MPVLIAALLSGLASITSSLVGRVLLALGLQFVTYQGFDLLISSITGHVADNLTGGGFSGTAAQIISVFRVGEVVSILSSAVASAMTIRGIRSGALTKLVQG